MKLSIKGIVTPSSWDAAGSVTGVSISATDEAEYAVAATGKGRDLLHLIHEAVAVRGVLVIEPHGSGIFQVDAYQVLQGGDEPDCAG